MTTWGSKRVFVYQRLRNLRPGQDTIVFKLYVPIRNPAVPPGRHGLEAKSFKTSRSAARISCGSLEAASKAEPTNDKTSV